MTLHLVPPVKTIPIEFSTYHVEWVEPGSGTWQDYLTDCKSTDGNGETLYFGLRAHEVEKMGQDYLTGQHLRIITDQSPDFDWWALTVVHSVLISLGKIPKPPVPDWMSKMFAGPGFFGVEESQAAGPKLIEMPKQRRGRRPDPELDYERAMVYDLRENMGFSWSQVEKAMNWGREPGMNAQDSGRDPKYRNEARYRQMDTEVRFNLKKDPSWLEKVNGRWLESRGMTRGQWDAYTNSPEGQARAKKAAAFLVDLALEHTLKTGAELPRLIVEAYQEYLEARDADTGGKLIH